MFDVPFFRFEPSPLVLDYAAFKPIVESFFHDASVPDSTLQARARHLLRVLEDPDASCYIYTPAWFEHNETRGPRPKRLTARRVFDAMYRTAADLGLPTGSRYVSACVLACGHLAENVPRPYTFAQEMAQSLSVLAVDVWAVRMWSTLTPRPDRIMVPNLGGVMKPELLARDAYTCFKTGQVDPSAPPAMSGEREDLECARICHMPLTEYHKEWLPETSQWVADFYEHYLGVDISAIPMLRADNHLLLSPQSCELFYQWIWTLKPTEIPNRYQVIDSRRENDGDGGARDGDFVTFENHDPKGSRHILEPAELPSRDALLVHAAYTSVRHLSGFMDESKDFLDDPNFSFLERTGVRRTYSKECEACSYAEKEEDSLEDLDKVTDDSDGEASTASRRGGRLRRAAHTLKGLFICG